MAFGLLAKTPAGANSLALLPRCCPSSAARSIPTGSMSGALRWFARNEPFTPVIDTMRGLLTGTGIGDSAILAIAWCAGLTLVGHFWARARTTAARRPDRDDDMPTLTISQLAAHVGVTVRAIRHYHQRGLAEGART